MSTNAVILILITVLAVLFVFFIWLAVGLHRRGIGLGAILTIAAKGITYAQAIAVALAPFVPKLASSIISLVLKIAAEAVQRVEATYKAALVADIGTADTRAAEAKALIISGLALKGITVTDDISKLIDAIVPVLVLALPKTHTVPAAPQAITV